jgi:AmiR/NasT family two-component response regulator
VLIERHGLDRTGAFELLRGSARSSRRRIHDLAGEVVDRREDPTEVVAFRRTRS